MSRSTVSCSDKLYFNSRTFNQVVSWKNKDDPVAIEYGIKQSNDNFHNNKYECNTLETKWISIAVDRWKNGIKTKEARNIYINNENNRCDFCIQRILDTKF